MYRVLIVEDDPMVAMIHAKYIGHTKNFCVAGQCRDGEEVLHFLESNTVDLLILDVYMPRMNGLETLRRIRERKFEAAVIMVTAANDAATLKEALNLGAVDYLVKPFSSERLLLALNRFAAQTAALKGNRSLSQQNIDHIMESTRYPGTEELPKGIQEKTLSMILNALDSAEGLWLSGDDIAERLSLSSVTVRRYMNYLVQTGGIESDINYETGGRPCMMYRRC